MLPVLQCVHHLPTVSGHSEWWARVLHKGTSQRPAWEINGAQIYTPAKKSRWLLHAMFPLMKSYSASQWRRLPTSQVLRDLLSDTPCLRVRLWHLCWPVSLSVSHSSWAWIPSHFHSINVGIRNHFQSELYSNQANPVHVHLLSSVS